MTRALLDATVLIAAVDEDDSDYVYRFDDDFDTADGITRLNATVNSYTD